MNGLSSLLNETVPLLIWSLRTLSPSRYRYNDVSSSHACEQPPGNWRGRHRAMTSLSTDSSCHHAQQMHSASVSKFVLRATRSKFGMFEPCPFSKMIFLNP